MTQLVTFTLGAHTFGLDVAQVQEVIRTQARTRIPLAPVGLAGLINLRGQVITAVDLRSVLGLQDAHDDGAQMMVLVEHDEELIALIVDQIGAVVDVTVDEFEPAPDTLSGRHRELIRGAYKLDRTLLLALDLEQALAA